MGFMWVKVSSALNCHNSGSGCRLRKVSRREAISLSPSGSSEFYFFSNFSVSLSGASFRVLHLCLCRGNIRFLVFQKIYDFF